MVAALEAVPPASIRFAPQSIQVGARTIPTDPQHCIWVRFPAGAGQPGQGLSLDFHPIAAARFLQPESPVLRRLDGTVAIVGNFAVEARDLVLTAGGTMRTMQVETCVLDTILSGRFLRRPGVAWGVAIPLVLALTMGFCLPLLRPAWQLVAALGLSLAWTVLNVVAFTRGLWLHLATPLAVVILVFLVAACLGLARSTRIFGQFLAPDLARGLVAGPERAGLGGQEKVCTILFFSLPACFKQDLWDPATLLERRNQFTSMAAEVVQAWGGRVMDFQGDAQMVLFGAPRELPDHAAAATGAALEMVEQASRRVAGWNLEDPTLGEIHAGVCTGPLAVGFVGSERHKEFAALGDTTNVAARLYAAAIRLGIPVLIAGSTMEAARGAILADPLPPVALKGKSQPVPVCRARQVCLRVEES
jgi:adenylate cyclase